MEDTENSDARVADDNLVTAADSVADTGGRGRTTSVERRHTLTTNETLARFEAAGMPRSQRSIERYCADGKLDCIKDPDEGRHYVTPESADRLIAYLKELQLRHKHTVSPATGQGGTSQDLLEPFAGDSELKRTANAADAMDSISRRAKVERLQHELAFKDMYIDKLEEEREKDKGRLVEAGRQVGQLESELRLLAPRSSGDARSSTERDAEQSLGDDVDH